VAARWKGIGQLGERLLLIITAAVGAFVVLGLGAGIFFAQRSLNNIRDEKVRIKEQAKGLDRKIDSPEMRTIEAQATKWEDTLEECQTILPKQADVDNIVRDYAIKAGKYNLDLVSFQQSKQLGSLSLMGPMGRGQQQKPYEKIEYKGKLRGSFSNIVFFLNRIEEPDKGERWLSIDDIHLKTASKGLLPGTSRHELSFTVVAYKHVEREKVVTPPGTGAAGAGGGGAPGTGGGAPGTGGGAH